MSRTGWALWTGLIVVFGGLLYAWALGLGPWKDPEPIGSKGVEPWMQPGDAPQTNSEATTANDGALGHSGESLERPGERSIAVEESAPAEIRGVLLRALPGVEASDGQPAAGVTVRLSAYRSRLEQALEVQTDEHGRFAIPIPERKSESTERMTCKLRVAGDAQWRSLEASEVVEFPDPETREVQLVQYGWDAVYGRVTDVLLQPLPELALRVTGQGEGALPKGEQRSVLSGEDGSFRFPVGWIGPLDVETPGFTLLFDSGWQVTERGEALPRELVVAAHASLAITVRDDLGEPVVDRLLSVRIAQHEAQGTDKVMDQSKRGWSARGKTDADGRIVFEELPAQQCLVVYSPIGALPRWREDGALVEESALAPRLVLQPGEEREATVTTQALRRIGGVVFEPDGKPSPNASYGLRHFDPQQQVVVDYLNGGFADEHGVWETETNLPADGGSVLVVAQGRIGEVPSLSPFGGPKPPDPLHVGWALAPWPWDGNPVTIQLQVMEKLGGRVVDPQGQPVPAEIRLQPHVNDWLPLGLLSGLAQETRADEQGFFAYRAVPKGNYRMVVRAKGHATKVLPTIPAGPQDMRIVLESTEPTQLTVRVHSEAPIREYVFLCTRLDPLDGASIRVPRLAETTRVDQPKGWPDEATRVWYGSSSYRGPLGRASFHMSPSDQAEKTFTIDPGLYWIGAKAAIVGGGTTFPMGTGLVEVGAGSYTVDVHVQPMGRLEGRVQPLDQGAAEPGQEMHLAIAEPGGEVLAVQGLLDNLRRYHELGTDGCFTLYEVPVGTWELRLGPKPMLEKGDAMRRYRVTVTAGENDPIEWWL